VFYVYNWLHIFSVEGTPGVGHLWSLSAEEQFYVAWPVILALSLRAGPRLLLALSLAALAVSASMPFWPTVSYDELYGGTHFRAQELMAGAVLAQLRYVGMITPGIVTRVSFRVALVLSFAFFALYLFSLRDRDVFMFSGMYTATAVFGAVIVCAVLYAPPRILTHSAIRYVGTRSYALYLWHHAIAFWLVPMDEAIGLVLGFALSFSAAELSWRLVEQRGNWSGILFSAVRERWQGRRAVRAVRAVDVRPQPSD
jgi:peptidoglycan/LPS O-acetylase OafA/YrhL